MWDNLKSNIASVIKENNNQEITGAILKNALFSIINNVGKNASFAGVATPNTNPGIPDGPVFYLATKEGIYSNFNSLSINEGINIIKYDGSAWLKEQLTYKDGGVFDISAYNGASYNDISDALGDNGSNIPEIIREGGMTVRFRQGNKYKTFTLIMSDFSTSPSDWREIGSAEFLTGEKVNEVGIDDEPTAGSNNLVKSGVVYNELALGAVYDVSAKNDNAIFASLSALLSSPNLGTLIPTSIRRRGMSIKFLQEITPAQYTVVKTEGLTAEPTGTELSTDPNIVSGTYTASQLNNLSTVSALPSTLNSSKTYYLEVAGDSTTYTKWVVTYAHTSDNKYVQYRLTAYDWSTDVADWKNYDVGNVIENAEMDEVLEGGVAVFLTDVNGNAVLDESGKPIEII